MVQLGGAILTVFILIAGILLAIEIGYKIGSRQFTKEGADLKVGVSHLEGAIFSLMGLLIAFSFSGSASRFDNRRQLVIQEANAISTAWLRVELLPDRFQTVLRDDMKKYLSARIHYYEYLHDSVRSKFYADQYQGLQHEIWKNAVRACKTPEGAFATNVMVPALNEMFDITDTRALARELHPPRSVFVMLLVATVVGAFLIGFSMAERRNRSWWHRLCFSVIVAVTLYLILDMEFPRMGLISMESTDHFLKDLLKQFSLPSQ